MDTAIITARGRFPAGLVQPPGSFRFSLDALLLASFTLRVLPRREERVSLLDIGCGCGVIGLACLLERENLIAKGVDREPELVAAAGENAGILGVKGRYATALCDLTEETGRVRLTGEKADVVLANMPYRQETAGRLPRSALRRRALFADETTMPAFLLTAKAVLKPDGVFTLIYPWPEREKLFAGLNRHDFFADMVLPVCAANKEPTFCLVSAVRERLLPKVLPPLALRCAKGAYTEEALSFCRWL